MTTLRYREINTVLGPMVIVMTQEKVIRIDYGSFDSLATLLEKWAKRYLGDVEFLLDETCASQTVKELGAYFNEQLTSFTFDYMLYGTDFQKQVWQALLEDIPYGETRTYKEIAVSINNPKSVRAVGGAVGKNPLSIVVPCHRVIGTSGKMIGYNGGLDKKEVLLEIERKSV